MADTSAKPSFTPVSATAISTSCVIGTISFFFPVLNHTYLV
ncbi:Uncharacterised protein [uncultured archaeon]|nr:Uncharacterised protein [uncultured archaeon]